MTLEKGPASMNPEGARPGGIGRIHRQAWQAPSGGLDRSTRVQRLMSCPPRCCSEARGLVSTASATHELQLEDRVLPSLGLRPFLGEVVAIDEGDDHPAHVWCVGCVQI